jgi:hypothetical protein
MLFFCLGRICCSGNIFRVLDTIKEKNMFVRGEKNCNWKGGLAYYPNHSEMKRVRKEVLKEANNICQFCGGFTNRIHHKDLSKDNHSKTNLVACCQKCNQLPEHRKPKKLCTSKYKRIFGCTLDELSEQFHIGHRKTRRVLIYLLRF